MTRCLRLPHGLHRKFRVFLWVPLLVLTAIAAETKRSFDLPAGRAAQTLKQFAAQAGREIVFSTEVIGDVRTPAVRGELTPNDALLALLAGTGLIAGQDSRTGAIAVRKEADPNAVRAAPLESRDRPATATGRDSETVELSPFVVNTARDRGYVAENTLAGSRLNTKLRDTPGSISVFTREFLDELGINDIRQLVEYSVNSEVDVGTGAGGPNQNTYIDASNLNVNVRTRGISASQ